MKIGTLNGKLNHWQAGIAWGKIPDWRMEIRLQDFFIHIWCFKLRSLPPQGEMITPENYRGFRFYKEFNFPFHLIHG